MRYIRLINNKMYHRPTPGPPRSTCMTPGPIDLPDGNDPPLRGRAKAAMSAARHVARDAAPAAAGSAPAALSVAAVVPAHAVAMGVFAVVGPGRADRRARERACRSSRRHRDRRV